MSPEGHQTQICWGVLSHIHFFIAILQYAELNRVSGSLMFLTFILIVESIQFFFWAISPLILLIFACFIVTKKAQ